MQRFVGDITIEDIIKNKINFILNNNIFDEKEYKLYNKGEISSYNEMLKDIRTILLNDFIEKYLNIFKNNNIKIERSDDEGQKENMIGYNNAIISVLELIDPIYSYCDL